MTIINKLILLEKHRQEILDKQIKNIKNKIQSFNKEKRDWEIIDWILQKNCLYIILINANYQINGNLNLIMHPIVVPKLVIIQIQFQFLNCI